MKYFEHKRLNFLIGFFFLAFLGLFIKLFYWQVVKGGGLSVLARNQYEGGLTIDAPRGEILSKDGSWLSASGESWLFYAQIPDLEEKPEILANRLAQLLVPENSEDLKEEIYKETLRLTGLLSKEGAVWVPLKRGIDRITKEKIDKLGIKGLGFEAEEKRIYPEASTAAHVLGFVGKDEKGTSKGYFGLEGFYDFILSGKDGYISREEDVRGVPMFLGGTKEIVPVAGTDLLTHIDKIIQLSLDDKLKKGIEKYGAVSGTVSIMDPQSGSVIAMSSYPSYDPDKYSEYGDELFKNPIISSTFEPGSVFKVVVMASALDAGVVTPDTKCTICNGPFNIGKYTINTWDGKSHPDSTMTEVIKNSDNVGMTFVGNQLGKDKMFDYLSKFGIGSLTGIDLQGEATAKLREKGNWGEIDVATASFGQGVAVTPIQILKAVAVIANDGEMVTPQVVDKIVSDTWLDDLKPRNEGRVISSKAADEVTAMMIEAAKNGEAKWTNLPGFKVAGKTGTAQIPIQGHYDEDRTIASFVGFAPYDDPRFVMFVTLQEPQSSPWASETAAPLWYSIAKDLFNYYGLQPDN